MRLGFDVSLGASELLEARPGPPIHPLDYDWRFNARTVAYMRATLAQVGASVAFLCCPSMCVEAAGWNRAALLDRNALWRNWIGPTVEFAVADLTEFPDDWQDAFDAVLLDPPWYEPEFRRGLSTATKIVREGGTIFTSWPAPTTRPNLREELSRFVAFANELGLEIDSTDENVLTYATPFFEGVSMRAAGIPVLASWRRADLIRCIRRRRTSFSHGQQPKEPNSGGWTDHRLGRLQIRLSPDLGGVVDPRLVSLVQGDVLHSVSRRDPMRAAARVWTGGNRIFHCERPDLLATVVENLAQDPIGHVEAKMGRNLSAEERRLVEDSTVQIRNLEATETSEYDLLHGITRPASGSGGSPQDGT